MAMLRQPAGAVLEALIAAGGAGMCDGSTGADPAACRFAKARGQLDEWGLARFEATAHAPGKLRFRVTALGRAADAWGWAALHADDTRVSSRLRRLG